MSDQPDITAAPATVERMEKVTIQMPTAMRERLERLAASRFTSTASEGRRAIAFYLDAEDRAA